MARAKISLFIYLITVSQICSRRQCEANTIPQQTVQNKVVNTQNLNQNTDLANLNAQKQAVGQQQNLNLQQFASIPMQTFNAQQPANSHHQGNSQQTNYQTVNQALNKQQVPQHYNLQDVPMNNQQAIQSTVNLQQATVIPVNSQQSSSGHTKPQAVIVQQPQTVQGPNLQQQAYPLNLQQSQASQFQQASPQSTSLQLAVAQPVKVQQQATQQSVPLTANLQNQGAMQMGNLQKTAQTATHSQQPSTVQSVTYQQPVQQYDPISVTQLNVQQPQILQQMPTQQIDFHQQIPSNNRGNYQVISYQKPCQLSEATPTIPMTLPLSTLSSNPNPTIIAAVPASMTIPSTATQTDQIYILSPQNYLTTTPYSPRVLTDTLQSSLSGPTIQVPIITVPNSVPSPNSNFATSNCNQQFETENWIWSQKIPDIGMLNDLQFPIASLLGQPTSSIQSALLSSILSSIQGPATSPQYIISSGYPAQTIVNPQISSQSSKLSLKSILPLLLNMLQDKYSNSGCQCCNCCNCECSNNKNVMQVNTENKESQNCIATPIPAEVEEENVLETIKNDDSTEIEGEPVNASQRKRPNNNQNIIPNDSTEIDDVENSSCVDEDDEGDLIDESGETNRNN